MLIGMAQDEDHQMRPTLQRNEYNDIIMCTDAPTGGDKKKIDHTLYNQSTYTKKHSSWMDACWEDYM